MTEISLAFDILNEPTNYERFDHVKSQVMI
jgi:hypothetical protein